MLIGVHNYYPEFNKQNAIFNPAAYAIGENLEYPSVMLKKKAEQLGHIVATLDMYSIQEYQKILFFDLPSPKNPDLKALVELKIDLYLIVLESEIIKPGNWDTEYHKYFKKIFVWNEKWVDNKKYFLLKYAFKIPEQVSFNISAKTKLCTLIACHKSSNDKRELYSERVKTIRWFEEHHPEDFDLYGMGWEQRTFIHPFGRLNSFNFLRKTFYKPFPSYKGSVVRKREVLSKYKFSICYENARDVHGYITEKIFDCFFAGCVPVYWGAPNITDYIPENAFIDRRKYESHEKLYDFMISMSEAEYKKYLENIKDYVYSNKILPFTCEQYTDVILREVLDT